MNCNTILVYFKGNYKVILFYIVFAIVQFYFFWGLCHLMPGERYYQRKARIITGRPAPPPVIDSKKKSQIPNFETSQGHIRQIHDELRRTGQKSERAAVE